MLKKALIRGVLSFSCSVAINVVLYAGIIALGGFGGQLPMLPEYLAHFDNEVLAMLTQCLLVGLTATVFGAGAVIMETEKIGLVVQSVIYFVITTAVWVPVACFCWGLHKYPSSIIGVGISYVISYVISWVIQYKACKKNVELINRRLQEIREVSGNL